MVAPILASLCLYVFTLCHWAHTLLNSQTLQRNRSLVGSLLALAL